jgi:hypothetical protein
MKLCETRRSFARRTNGLIVFNTCRNLIRTLPAMIYSRTNPEDIDDTCEQHAVDALRYGLTRRKIEFRLVKVM